MSLQYIYQNGHYIPFLYPIVYSFLQNHLLTSTILLKALAVNFFIHFGHLLSYAHIAPPPLKAFVRFTDSGYIATFLTYFQPKLFPIAFNVHMFITIAFFTVVLCFSDSDVDDIYDDAIDFQYTRIWSYTIHGLFTLFFLYHLVNPKNKTTYTFNNETYFQTLTWMIIWFCLIYIPWRLLTGDPVYAVLGDDSSTITKIGVVCLVFVIFYITNSIGRVLSSYKSLFSI